MSFIVKCRVAVRDNKAFQVDEVRIQVRMAKLLSDLYDGMRISDRGEFFDLHPREIIASIKLSISGGA